MDEFGAMLETRCYARDFALGMIVYERKSVCACVCFFGGFEGNTLLQVV